MCHHSVFKTACGIAKYHIWHKTQVQQKRCCKSNITKKAAFLPLYIADICLDPSPHFPIFLSPSPFWGRGRFCFIFRITSVESPRLFVYTYTVEHIRTRWIPKKKSCNCCADIIKCNAISETYPYFPHIQNPKFYWRNINVLWYCATGGGRKRNVRPG